MRPGRLVPAGVAIVAASCGFARYSYGLFVPDIRAELGVSTAVLGLVASGGYVGYLASTAVTAAIAARTGPRLPVVAGGISAAVGMLLIASAQGPWILALGVVLAGTSAGWAYTPFSDAVVRLLPESSQSRSYAIINSGTSVGVLVAGPIAITAGRAWRWAWVAFAVISIAAAVWNAALLPGGGHDPGHGGLPRLRWSWLVGPRSRRLFLVAFTFGIATSVYWTFAVDVIRTARGGAAGLGPIFWTVVGGVGVAGALAGDAVHRLGLRRALPLTLAASAVATWLLTLAPGVVAVVIASAVLFGASFISITGILGVWSVAIFHDRPSAGLGAMFFLMVAGQAVGPAVFGLLAEQASLTAVFGLAAALTASLVVVRPREQVSSMNGTDDERQPARGG